MVESKKKGKPAQQKEEISDFLIQSEKTEIIREKLEGHK